jgi:ABC-type proline/glycine betaine transport system permease subunit
MNDLWVTPMVAVVGALILAVYTSRTSRWEAGVLWLSWIAHAVSAVAMVLLTKYFFGGGDMIAYHREALVYADLLRGDSAYFSDILLYSIGQNPQNPMLFLAGTSTGAMFGAGTFLSVLLGGSL